MAKNKLPRVSNGMEHKLKTDIFISHLRNLVISNFIVSGQQNTIN